MMAFSVQQTQRKLQTLGAAGIVLAAALSLIVVAPALAGGPAAPSVATYNVSFNVSNGTGQGASGSAGFLSTVHASIPVEQHNLTMVVFHISYVDNSISPLFNPAVTITILGPNGSGGSSGSVPPGANQMFQAPVNNLVPDNTTVQATSPEDALKQAAGTTSNSTLGVGDWDVQIDVGSPLGGRIRPSGSITYTITVDFVYFEGTAVKA